LFNEKFLYHIWDEQHIKYDDTTPKTLKSIAGNTIKVHFQGHYNTYKGADFKNGIIEINGIVLNGDIEIHMNSSDWYHHEHDSNPDFNSVVLHVVFKHNNHREVTFSEDNKYIEILELHNIISPDIEKLFIKYTADKKDRERYCQLFSKIRPEFINQFLISKGIERFEKKVKRFVAELSFVSMDQLFYQSILESLGYSKNKHQFYNYSKDWNYLYYKQKFISDDKFVDEFIKNAGFEKNSYDWYLFRIRPCNHPKVRLYQISTFIYDSFRTSLVSEINKLFSFTVNDYSLKKLKRRLYERFCVENNNVKYKLGKERVNAMAVNIFLPLLYIHANNIHDKQLLELCKKIYLEYPALEENQITITMKKYMTDEQYKQSQSSAINQQGLIHIYNRFCYNHLCGMCENQNIISDTKG
jgi:hypothetical protein